MAGKSVDKYIVTATGKVDGKATLWVAAVFNSIKEAGPWVAMVKLHRAAGSVDNVKAMDAHQPGIDTGKLASDVKYRGAVIQYNPVVNGLDAEEELGGAPKKENA